MSDLRDKYEALQAAHASAVLDAATWRARALEAESKLEATDSEIRARGFSVLDEEYTAHDVGLADLAKTGTIAQPQPQPHSSGSVAVDTVFQQKYDALIRSAMSAVVAWRCPTCAGPGTIDYALPQDDSQPSKPVVWIICINRCNTKNPGSP